MDCFKLSFMACLFGGCDISFNLADDWQYSPARLKRFILPAIRR